jgi:hypothetical protein
MDIRNDRILKLKHSSTDMASFWLSLWQEYSNHHTEGEWSTLSFLCIISVELDSLLWTWSTARIGWGFKHWRRTWGYACQPSDLRVKYPHPNQADNGVQLRRIIKRNELPWSRCVSAYS